ncbi:MAG: hypothetical protein IBX55_15660 [Methyloprofundus sp.]|uniref:hypothetical protein n=1 Tax=Thiomicrospira sp. TaxID=935 RepID=UPI0019E92A82|nr:hypothetical protein [Methyloprofundus sp.]
MEIKFADGDIAIKAVNERLYEIEKLLRELQPKDNGTVLLRLQNCGKSCYGCPHAKWEVWKRVKRHDQNSLYLGYTIKYPLKAIRRSGKYEANYPQVWQLISEAQTLLKFKKDLIQLHGILAKKIKNFS